MDHTEIKSTVSNVIEEYSDHIDDFNKDRESVVEYYISLVDERLEQNASRIRIKQYVLAEIGNRRTEELND